MWIQAASGVCGSHWHYTPRCCSMRTPNVLKEATVRARQQLFPDRSRGKVAANDVDKFLKGLLQCVNVHSQTICFHLPLFTPAGLIEQTIATRSARFI